MSELTDKGPAVLTTLRALTSTACIFVAARLLVRLYLLKKGGWDDALITLSLVSLTLTLLSFIYSNADGDDSSLVTPTPPSSPPPSTPATESTSPSSPPTP